MQNANEWGESIAGASITATNTTTSIALLSMLIDANDVAMLPVSLLLLLMLLL